MEDYSDEPIFDAEEEVGLGDIRIYQGVAYVSTVVSHEFNNTPNCSTEWQVAPKFAKECFNEMWEEGGMRKLIAWVIFCEAIVFYPNLLMSGGFQEKDDEYMKLVNLKRNSLNKQILMMHRQFVDWNEDNGCIEFRQDLCVDEALNIVKNKSNRKVLWR